jgi:triosephosphate isomerase (TIM)
MRKFIVGNWKMNGMLGDLVQLEAICAAAENYKSIDFALCLPATLISAACLLVSKDVVGAQDCHHNSSGAHTGCISAQMIAEAGASIVILGHSERRAAQGETNEQVQAKALAARAAGMSVIICVGETEAQHNAGQANEAVMKQLQASVPENANADWVTIAYEPIWAIGTGRIPAPYEIEHIHAGIREALKNRFGEAAARIRILYGGSMAGENAVELLAIENVDGGLIGGASLQADKLIPIMIAASK